MERIVNCLASHVCGRCLACVSLQEAAPPDDIVAAVAEADAENADLPTLNHSDNKVRDPSGTIIGAVTIMHPNTKGEAVSVYCRLHGCKAPCKRLHQAPSTVQILRWFKRGYTELSRNRLDREAHLQMYRDLTSA